MNNLKLLGYELKRMLFSKIYLALILISGIFTYFLLTEKLILGIADSAPFSAWSYSSFLCDITPLLMVILLFSCLPVFSKKEAAVRTISLTTPLKAYRYYLNKIQVIVAAFLIPLLLAIAISFAFLYYAFHFSHFSDFVGPVLLVVLPSLVLVLALGLLAGSFNSRWIYVLLPLVFLAGSLNISIWPDIFARNFILTYPFTLSPDAGGEIPFHVPTSIWVNRLALTAIGLAVIGYVLAASHKKIKVKKTGE